MSGCLKGSICFQLDCSFCQAFCYSAIIISAILQILLSGLFPTQMKVRGQGYWRWASSLPCLLFELVFWLYELLGQLNWNMFSYRCAGLICFFFFLCAVGAFCTVFPLTCCFLMEMLFGQTVPGRSRVVSVCPNFTDPLSCVPETKGSLISVRNVCGCFEDVLLGVRFFRLWMFVSLCIFCVVYFVFFFFFFLESNSQLQRQQGAVTSQGRWWLGLFPSTTCN